MNQHISTYVSSVSTYLSTWEWSETVLFWMIWMACKFIKCREWHAKICQLAVHGHHDLAASPLLFLGKSIPQCHDLPRFFFALKSFAQRKPHQLNLLEGFTMDFARKNIMVCSWKCEWSMSKSQSNSEQIWTNLNKTQLDFKAFDSWPWRPWLVRSARRLIFAFAVAFVTAPSSRARRRAFLRQSRATTLLNFINPSLYRKGKKKTLYICRYLSKVLKHLKRLKHKRKTTDKLLN